MSRHFLLHWHDSRIHYLHILYMYYFYREQLCNQQSDHNDSKNHYFNALNWLPNGQLFFALLSIWMIKVCITVTGFWKTVICPKVTRGKKCPSTTYICVGAQKWGFTTSTMNWNFFHIRLQMLLGSARQFKENNPTTTARNTCLSILCWLLYVSTMENLTSNQALWPFSSQSRYKSRCIPLSKYLSDRSIYIFPAMLKFLIQTQLSSSSWQATFNEKM